MDTVDLTCPNCQETVACPAETCASPHFDVANLRRDDHGRVVETEEELQNRFSCAKHPMVTDSISGTRSDDVTQLERAQSAPSAISGEGVVENPIQLDSVQLAADVSMSASTIAAATISPE